MTEEEVLGLIKTVVDVRYHEWLTSCVHEVAKPYTGPYFMAQGLYPDFADAAALGCLRHLAAKAHGAFDIHVQMGIAPRMEGSTGRWRAVDGRGRLMSQGGFVVPPDEDAMAYGLFAALEAGWMDRATL